MRLFDIHQHLGSRERLTGRMTRYEFTEAVQKHLRYMDKHEIERACLIASHNSLLRSPDDVREVNTRIAEACRIAPDRFVAGAGTVDPGIGDRGLAEIDYCARELGLPAIAWHTRFQGTFLDSGSVRRYVEHAASLDMTIFLHILGESTSEAAWRLTAIAEEFPQVRIVALDAFTSFDQGEWVVSVGGKTSNVTYDLSLMFPDAAFIAKFVAAYGSQRLVFGTDYYDDMELRVPVGRYAVEMAGLSAADQDNICWRNASRLLGLAE